MARPRTVGRKMGIGIRVKFNLKRECGQLRQIPFFPALLRARLVLNVLIRQGWLQECLHGEQCLRRGRSSAPRRQKGLKRRTPSPSVC